MLTNLISRVAQKTMFYLTTIKLIKNKHQAKDKTNFETCNHSAMTTKPDDLLNLQLGIGFP